MTLLKTKGRSDLYVQSNVWTQGSGFVDEGGGQVRVLRNEGTVDARTIAVQLVPRVRRGGSTPLRRPPTASSSHGGEGAKAPHPRGFPPGVGASSVRRGTVAACSTP
jgi:hypothetical protein